MDFNSHANEDVNNQSRSVSNSKNLACQIHNPSYSQHHVCRLHVGSAPFASDPCLFASTEGGVEPDTVWIIIWSWIEIFKILFSFSNYTPLEIDYQRLTSNYQRTLIEYNGRAWAGVTSIFIVSSYIKRVPTLDIRPSFYHLAGTFLCRLDFSSYSNFNRFTTQRNNISRIFFSLLMSLMSYEYLK